ncbi:MAG: small acid-soluble spore protein Tlp [Papillibacter sp.]|nr:small acid-soluble spore protein Tlp [Papillibacter sp.]
MTHKPDNRADNVAHLQQHIDNTVRNIRKAEEAIRAADNEKTKAELSAKNERREEALDGFRREIKEEAAYKELKS